MSDPIRIVLDGFAQAQKAPQGVIMPPLPKPMRGRYHIQMYTPAEVRKWQYDLKRSASEQMNGRSPLIGALAMSIAIYLPIPKSMPKKSRVLAEDEMLYASTRPDCDNYAKAIADSLNGVAYLDDGQIGKLVIEKLYSNKPRVEITVSEIGQPSRLAKEQTPLFPAKERLL